MKKIYLGMGCFWSSQYLMKKYFPNKIIYVGYMDNIEVVEIDYVNDIDLFEILKVFFENQSFTLKEIPRKYISCIFYTEKRLLAEIKYLLNHYNQRIKLSGKIGHLNTQIDYKKQFKIADESQQDYLEKNKNIICVLNKNGLNY